MVGFKEYSLVKNNDLNSLSLFLSLPLILLERWLFVFLSKSECHALAHACANGVKVVSVNHRITREPLLVFEHEH